ncbi:hypothetical protein BDV93DRAFT_564546 [Ceratobasidium sp. AG-I]|nr:hypothetical protein BDV93DRAFT_564546 [Ceratobasidium sp. AG-I]
MSSAHWAQQIPLEDVIHWLEMMIPGAAEAHPEVNNQTPPPIAYIAALFYPAGGSEHIYIPATH